MVFRIIYEIVISILISLFCIFTFMLIRFIHLKIINKNNNKYNLIKFTAKWIIRTTIYFIVLFVFLFIINIVQEIY